MAGLAALAAWSAVSLAWAPLAGPAFRDVQRLVLYLGALIAAAALLRDRRAGRAVEPALAAGTLIVVGYGVSDRLLPGIIHLHHTATSLGRLDLPLTYWNAMGALAAMGFVLCARLAGDTTRADAVRIAAMAAAAPLGLGTWLSLSRGALAALAAGLVVLLAVAPAWPQLRAVGLSLLAGAVATLVGSQLRGVESLTGSLSTREGQGAAMLAVLLVVIAAAAAVQARACRLERAGRRRTDALSLPRRFPLIAVGLVVVLMAGTLLVGAAREHRPPRAPAAPRAGWRRYRPTGTSTGAWPCAPSPTIRSRASARAVSGWRGCASARSATPPATRIPCTSRRQPSSGSSAWPRWPQRSPAWCCARARRCAAIRASPPARWPRPRPGRCTRGSTGTGRCPRSACWRSCWRVC